MRGGMKCRRGRGRKFLGSVRDGRLSVMMGVGGLVGLKVMIEIRFRTIGREEGMMMRRWSNGRRGIHDQAFLVLIES